MAWIPSEQITVFPTTRRLTKQQDARLMTEKSLVGIINQLIDKDAFVITSKSELENSTSDPNFDPVFEFNIHGYFFHVDKLSYITGLFTTSSSLSIYAYIQLDTGNGYTELLGQDDTLGNPESDALSKYKGVTFTDIEPSTSDNMYKLKILERSSSSSTTWTCPETSFYKFEGSTVDFQVDGGIIS